MNYEYRFNLRIDIVYKGGSHSAIHQVRLPININYRMQVINSCG